MEPQKGDKVIIVNGSGKPTHNVTKVGEVKGYTDECWHIVDKYKVPMRVVWDGKWVQVL